MDQLVEARAAHEAMAAKMKAEFDAEVTALCSELAEAKAEHAAEIEATREYFLSEAKALREILAAAMAEVQRMRAISELGNLEHSPTERLN
jgi:hypothetical protein